MSHWLYISGGLACVGGLVAGIGAGSFLGVVWAGVALIWVGVAWEAHRSAKGWKDLYCQVREKPH